MTQCAKFSYFPPVSDKIGARAAGGVRSGAVLHPGVRLLVGGAAHLAGRLHPAGDLRGHVLPRDRLAAQPGGARAVPRQHHQLVPRADEPDHVRRPAVPAHGRRVVRRDQQAHVPRVHRRAGRRHLHGRLLLRPVQGLQLRGRCHGAARRGGKTSFGR